MKKRTKKKPLAHYSPYNFFLSSILGINLDEISAKELKELGKPKVKAKQIKKPAK